MEQDQIYNVSSNLLVLLFFFFSGMVWTYSESQEVTLEGLGF